MYSLYALMLVACVEHQGACQEFELLSSLELEQCAEYAIQAREKDVEIFLYCEQRSSVEFSTDTDNQDDTE